MRELVVVPVFATKKIELRRDLFENMQHHKLAQFDHIRMQLPLLGILSLSGYLFVKDKTDIRDQNLLIVKTIL